MKFSKKALGVLTLALALSNTSNAVVVNVNWLGTITSTPIVGTIDIGDSITGAFSYDDTSSGLGSTDIAFYKTDHISSFSINGLSGSLNHNEIGIFNDNSFLGDEFGSRSSVTSVYTGDLINGFSVGDMFVRFNDLTNLAFSNSDLPSTLNTANFGSNRNSFLRLNLLGLINFEVDSFSASSTPSVSSVPEPPMLVLLGVAFLGLLGRKYKTA